MTPRHAPRLVGRYLLCETIAAGGMATVHLARLMGQEGFTRTVALKQLYPHFAQDRDFVSMFLDEARLLSRIRHPNVVAPLDIIALDAELFIAMEYVHGEALSQLARAAGGPVAPSVAAAILVQVLLGLHAAHEASGENGQPLGIVHRDVSPQNILVGEDGIARIVDFGIAKAVSRAQTTGEGRLKGKLGYMAPEQIRLQHSDRRTDLFTAGIVLWELLTGELLFPGDNPAAVLDAILRGEIVPPGRLAPGLSAEIDAVVMRALTTNVEQRFQTAREMAIALGQAVALASTLEVSSWVTALAGAELSRRAERIAEVERISLSELTQSRPIPVRELAARQSSVAPSTTPAPDGRVQRASDDPAAPALPTAVHTDLSIVPSSAHSYLRKGRRPSRALLFALPVALGGVAALAFYLRPEAPPPTVTAITASEPEASGTSVALASPSGVGGAATQEASAPPLPAEVTSSVSAAPPASAEVPVTRGRPAARRPQAPAPAQNKLTARPSPPAPAAVSPGSKCAVPYTIDKDGIKRFKVECF